MGDPADELIGSLVDGRYKVLEAMASGSMGAVYKAERIPVGKLVAIKFLHAAYAKEPEFLSRFERETRVMSKLAHPNCVSVVDFGVYEEKPYLVMDYITGTTLRSVIDLGPLAPARALAITRQIAAGLAHAHAQGIVHRDVKPANIMISEEIGTGEHVRILDFGLARLRNAVGRDATQSNVVVGTPNYMAPEQTIGGGIIDARTDVYAVGVVLFEMIAGERPFQAEDTLALLGMHRAAPIPKLADRLKGDVDLPDGLQQVIEKAMAKTPDDRYQSAIELAEAIDRTTGVREPRKPVIAATGSRRSRSDPAIAPTLQVDLAESVDESAPRAKKSSGMLGAFLAILVLGGGAYAAWYFKSGGSGTKVATNGSASIDAANGGGPASDTAEPVAGDTAELGSDTPGLVGSMIDAPAEPAIDAAELIDAAVPADASTAAALDAAVEPVGPGSAGSGSGSVDPGIEIEPDPEKADPGAHTPDDENAVEATDAPKNTQDAEKQTPPPPRAATIQDALAQIKAGKKDSAIATLRVLKGKNPKSAYYTFLLGNLYFDKRWWTVALAEYRTTLAINGNYKKNGTLIRNAIRMLASNGTVGPARGILLYIGKPASPALRYTAQNSKNPMVKRNAGDLLRRIGR